MMDPLPKEYDAMPPMIADMREPAKWISFVPGRYGRIDVFFLFEFLFEPGRKKRRNIEIGRLLAWNSEATLTALSVLDDAVIHDPEFVFSPSRWSAASWFFHPDKKPEDRERLVRGLFERRLREQELILDGTLERGHKAFGFYPLEGGS